MPLRLTVVEEDETLCPRADVPSEWLWSLVDYLSLQRVAVLYEYHATNFRVTFQRLGRDAAQRVLDEWAAAAELAARASNVGPTSFLARA